MLITPLKGLPPSSKCPLLLCIPLIPSPTWTLPPAPPAVTAAAAAAAAAPSPMPCFMAEAAALAAAVAAAVCMSVAALPAMEVAPAVAGRVGGGTSKPEGGRSASKCIGMGLLKLPPAPPAAPAPAVGVARAVAMREKCMGEAITGGAEAPAGVRGPEREGDRRWGGRWW